MHMLLTELHVLLAGWNPTMNGGWQFIVKHTRKATYPATMSSVRVQSHKLRSKPSSLSLLHTHFDVAVLL